MTGFPNPILFATDFSGRCDRPLERALGLARHWQSKLVLLHVLEPPHTELTDEERDVEEARITNKLRAQGEGSGVDIEPRIANGPVAATIASVAEEVEAGLIVTGVARYDELGDFILGTTVDRLVRRSHVPVLVVKEKPRSGYRTLLVATDFSNGSATALEVAVRFFPEATLNLAHAYHVPFEPVLGRDTQAPAMQAKIAEELDDFLHFLHVPADVRDRIDFHLDYGETAPVISGLVRSVEADLAVIGTHGKSGFVAATIGNNAKVLLESLTCDVMLVPKEAL